MKPIIFFAAALWASLAPLYAKAQCAVQPSCSSLGYTYTGSTSDCLSPALKCPFNTSYFNCVKKADVIKNMVLDWSKKKLINPTSSRYYVTSYGIVIGRIQDIDNVGAGVNINGISVSSTGVRSMWTHFYAQVAPGDYVKATGRNPDFYFVPYKNL